MNDEKHKSLLVIVIGLLVMYFIFSSKYLLYASVGVGVFSLLFPIVGDFILKIWFKIAEVLGFINTRILLSAIFFIFLTPFSWLQKLFTKGDNLKLKRSDESVYITRNHSYVSKDFDNIW